MKKLLILSLLIIAACAAPEVIEPVAPEPVACCRAMTAECLACTEGKTVEAFCAENPSTVGCEPAPEEPVVVPESELIFDEPTRLLQSKGADTRNYKFSYAPLPENKAQRTYFVNGEAVRIELYTSSVRSANSYDTVYLNLETREAIATCELDVVVCNKNDQETSAVEFDDYYIELPHEFMARLDNGELVGSVTYDGFVSDIVEAFLDGQYARLTINRFHGVPMKVELYDNAEHTGEASGQQNRDYAFNSVTEEQVTPPAGW